MLVDFSVNGAEQERVKIEHFSPNSRRHVGND